MSSEISFFEAASLFQDAKVNFGVLTIASVDHITLSLTPTIGNAFYSDSVLLLGISKQEQNRLMAIAGFDDHYPRYPIVEKIANQIDDNGNPYTTYKARLQGFDPSGKYKIADPASQVTVYSVDGYTFFSKDFADAIPLPTTYIRNAEEHAGITIEAISGNAYEDVFIGNDAGGVIGIYANNMSTLVNNFITALAGINNDSAAKTALENEVNSFTRAILERIMAYTSQGANADADDRILYWARIKSKVALQSHDHVLQDLKSRNELLKKFEERSRGLDSINFSATPTGAKKILLIGFDPNNLYPTNFFTNITQSSISAAAALTLHGETLTDGAANIGYIQSVVFPMRYHELQFNEGEGYVELYCKKFMDPQDANYTPIDMIIVLGHGKDDFFDIPRFIARKRSAIPDNNAHRKAQFPLTPAGNAFYETTLPIAKMVPNTNGATIYDIYYNQSYLYKDAAGNVQSYLLDEVDGKIPITNDPTGTDPANLIPTNANQNTITDTIGGMAHSIDAEVFYRLCLLRNDTNNAFQTGMIRVPKLQGSRFSVFLSHTMGTGYNPANVKVAIDELRSILKNACN